MTQTLMWVGRRFAAHRFAADHRGPFGKGESLNSPD